MVSVIVPNYNHAAYLRQRIDSILCQTYQDFELIILDDNSSDNSVKIIESYRSNPHVSHIVINEENSGNTFKQWNKGFELARGEYIWIAESDDYSEPDFLTSCIFELDRNPNSVLCHTDSHFVDENGCEVDMWLDSLIDTPTPSGHIYYKGRDFVKKNMLKHNRMYNASMVVFRKSAIAGVSNFYKTMRGCGDWVFWGEIAVQGEIITTTRKLNYFRQHQNKVTVAMKGEFAGYEEALRAIMHLRRISKPDFRTDLLTVGYVYKSILEIESLAPEMFLRLKKELLPIRPYAKFALRYYERKSQQPANTENS